MNTEMTGQKGFKINMAVSPKGEKGPRTAKGSHIPFNKNHRLRVIGLSDERLLRSVRPFLVLSDGGGNELELLAEDFREVATFFPGDWLTLGYGKEEVNAIGSTHRTDKIRAGAVHIVSSCYYVGECDSWEVTFVDMGKCRYVPYDFVEAPRRLAHEVMLDSMGELTLILSEMGSSTLLGMESEESLIDTAKVEAAMNILALNMSKIIIPDKELPAVIEALRGFGGILKANDGIPASLKILELYQEGLIMRAQLEAEGEEK